MSLERMRQLAGIKSVQKLSESVQAIPAIGEGAKVDRMVKHIAGSEKDAGHSDKDAESIAWATANKRGYLDNKNKKSHVKETAWSDYNKTDECSMEEGAGDDGIHLGAKVFARWGRTGQPFTVKGIIDDQSVQVIDDYGNTSKMKISDLVPAGNSSMEEGAKEDKLEMEAEEPYMEDINGVPDVKTCNQDNPASCRDACHMEESMLEGQNQEVARVMSELQQLSDLGYTQEEAFDKIAAGLHRDGYDEEEINQILHDIDTEMGVAGSNDDMSEFDGDQDDDFDNMDEPYGSHDMSDDAEALASAGFGSDEDYGYFGGDEMDESEFPMGQVSPEKMDAALQTMIDTMKQPGTSRAENELAWIAKTHNVPLNDLADAWHKYVANEKGIGQTFEEDFDLNNGYDDINDANPQDYFPTGADSPVMKSVGGNAKQGDNPEQKSVRISEEHADLHKELVYSYRNYLKETATAQKKS